MVDIYQAVRSAGGKIVVGDTRHDGADHEFRSVWDDDESIDAFIDSRSDITKSSREILAGYLTFFFSVS